MTTKIYVPLIVYVDQADAHNIRDKIMDIDGVYHCSYDGDALKIVNKEFIDKKTFREWQNNYAKYISSSQINDFILDLLARHGNVDTFTGLREAIHNCTKFHAKNGNHELVEKFINALIK